jgi:hypothetical protein
LPNRAACLKISPRKVKKRMGRPPVKASERRNRWVSFPLSNAQLKAYRAAAALGFKGDLAAFLRAAADRMAAQVAGEGKQLKQERAAFWREVAELLRDKLGEPPEP